MPESPTSPTARDQPSPEGTPQSVGIRELPLLGACGCGSGCGCGCQSGAPCRCGGSC
ncbi:hypothetical protein [Actinacidiphila sp. bgisy160]|jgi:hypothetical protein|uniref:hypothetical protein n=1 Tax=Actinacidiphila sp. bgisy160 TaxID=3413796 RepID=UPI003D707948